MNSILKLKFKEKTDGNISASEIEEILSERDGILECKMNDDMKIVEIIYTVNVISDEDITDLLEEKDFEIQEIIGEGGYS